MKSDSDNLDGLSPIAPAPVFRFVVELTTWTWLLVLGIVTFNINPFNIDFNSRMGVESWIFLLLLVISLSLLSQFNFPGDKKEHGILVPGWIRISIEIFSGFIGIFAAWFLFTIIGLFSQSILVLLSFFLDRERWKWLLGLRSDPPSFVLALGHYHEH